MPNQMVGIYFINSVDKYKDSYKEFEEMNHFTCNIYICFGFFILIKKYTAIYMYLKKWFTLVGSSSTKLSSNTT